MITLYLKPKKEESLLRRHPWVFSGAIARIDGHPEEGDWVRVVAHSGAFLAVGQYQVGSIAVRLFSFVDEPIGDDFLRARLREAFALRLALGLVRGDDSNAYRLIHGEGDYLPGLVVDVYAHTAVMQAHTAGMHRLRRRLAELLVEVAGADIRSVYYKSETTLPYKADLDPADGFLIGGDGDGDDLAVENGLRFHVDWLHGQKTGFFVDQRDNRALVERYARGRNVLNLCCYTGGFSCYALRGGATLVHSVDSSAQAIALARDNVALNFPGDERHEAFCDDASRFLDTAAGRYDLIILDPPAFAKHKNVVRNALVGYRRLNAKALAAIRPGGILFTFSCSQVVTKEEFRCTLFSAAAMARRRVRVLHQLHQPADHPVDIYHPEGEYLKGLVLEVEGELSTAPSLNPFPAPHVTARAADDAANLPAPRKSYSIIVAAADNDAIGSRGQMPWHLPADLRSFKAITLGHDVVMGRKTFESMGRPLPGRRNIVVSRREGLTIDGAEVFASLDEALAAAADGAFVIGGAEIYRQAWDGAARLYLTRVHTVIDDFDAAIPAVDTRRWRQVSSESRPADERNAFDITFEVYDNILFSERNEGGVV